MSRWISLWKPDHSLPYVLHCPENEENMLNGAIIIQPEAGCREGAASGVTLLRFIDGRGHQFEGRILAQSEETLSFLREKDNAQTETYFICPMTETEFQAYRAKRRLGEQEHPISREQLAAIMEEDFQRYG